MSEKREGDDKQMHERSDRDAVMDSLLVSLHEQPSEREQRVQRLLAKYEVVPFLGATRKLEIWYKD